MFGSKSPVGLDIGSHSVKVCQIKQVGQVFELERFGYAEIYPDGQIPSDPQQQAEAKINAVKRALSQGGIKAKKAVASISGESIIVRYLQLPEMPEDELKKALQWEAEEYIPFRLSEVYLDSQVLGRSTDADPPKMDVLLVSAKKDLVENRLHLIRGAGLDTASVDLDTFAFLNCFELNHHPDNSECVALINIGNENTNINIFHHQASRFSRDIPIGGDTLTAAVQSHLGCSFAEAERLKITHGAPPADANNPAPLDFSATVGESIRQSVEGMADQNANTPESAAPQAVNHALGNLLMEVRRSIEFFENQSRGPTVGRIIIGGGTARLNNLTQHFEADLRLPIESIDSLRKIRLGKDVDSATLQGLSESMSVCIGLGVRGAMGV